MLVKWWYQIMFQNLDETKNTVHLQGGPLQWRASFSVGFMKHPRKTHVFLAIYMVAPYLDLR